MRKLSTYIEYILMTRHYVFVPGIGGFLLRDVDASFSNNIYTPSHREIHFNRFLTNDDGMLANVYMTAEGIPYDVAISQIQIEVAGIKSVLNKKNHYELGSLGVLSYDSEHHLSFSCPKSFPIDPDGYGLSKISIRKWQEIEDEISSDAVSKSNTDKEDVLTIPKYLIRRAVACAIVILCFFANFNSGDFQRHYDYASVLNTVALFGNYSQNLLLTDNCDNSCEDIPVLTDIENIEVKTEIKTSESEIITVTQQPEKLYYIIIASCTSASDAERVIKKRKKEGYDNIGVLECEGRFRLYLKSFATRTEGERYLEEVRLTTPFQKAWLLPYRKESLLSYNLKKFDNDQFPVELSHPYQRTERDQGWINT